MIPLCISEVFKNLGNTDPNNWKKLDKLVPKIEGKLYCEKGVKCTQIWIQLYSMDCLWKKSNYINIYIHIHIYTYNICLLKVSGAQKWTYKKMDVGINKLHNQSCTNKNRLHGIILKRGRCMCAKLLLVFRLSESMMNTLFLPRTSPQAMTKACPCRSSAGPFRLPLHLRGILGMSGSLLSNRFFRRFHQGNNQI